jgi:hypothetical protein
MLTPRQSASSRSPASATNLFLDADPDEGALSRERSQQHRARRGRSGRGRRPRRGLLLPVGSSSTPHAARRDAATFTRAHGGAGGLATAARARLRRADARAATLLRRLAERTYGTLVATALLAAMLISLTWSGLAMRDASAARGAAEQERITALAALKSDQTRIAGLGAQLEQASVIALRREQASATAVASWQLRAHEAERRLARARRVPPPSPRDRSQAAR